MLFSLVLKNSKVPSRNVQQSHLIRIKIADEVRSTEKSLRIPFDANRSGKILDYMARDIERIDEPVSAEDSKELFSKPPPINPFKKGVPYGQVFTGNIAIDFTDPIPVGSFAYFRGTSNTGLVLFLDSIIQDYRYDRENASGIEHDSSIPQQQPFLKKKPSYEKGHLRQH